MDGSACPPASAEEEPSGGAVHLDPRHPAAAPAMIVPEEGQGYVDSLVGASILLLQKRFAPEVRRQGLKLMLHLLRFRWDELRVEEWSAFGDDADLIAGLYGTTDGLPSKTAAAASKSGIAALMAEVIWSGGISLLNDLLPSITFLSQRGPTEALSAFILKRISDFRIACVVDLEGGQFEAILSGQFEVLPNIMLILSSLLEKYGGGVLVKHPDQLLASSKKHMLTVTACLHAANAYAEWVPVVHLVKYGLIERCKSFLNFSNPHVLALRFFKVICQRRTLCATEDYDTAMSLIFWILIRISQDSLTKSKTNSGFLDESQLDFAGRICECLVALGSTNMQFIITDGNRATHFFRQMVITEVPKGKFEAPDPGVVASAFNPASVANSTEKREHGAFVLVTDDICEGIMEISFKRILKKSVTTSPELLELWSDELQGKNGFKQYRSILLDLIRFISYERPIVAASRAVQRISCIIGDASAASKHPKDLAAVESAQLGLETVVNAIFDDSTESLLDRELPLHWIYKIFEGLLVQLLSLRWTEPRLVVILGAYLNAFCPFLKHFPNAVTMAVTKLLDLLSSINVDCHDPSKAQHARFQICSCLIHICQAVDGIYLPPDMKDLFSVPHVTEEDVLAFVAIDITAYSVEYKQVGGDGNQDGGAAHPSSASYTMLSRQSSYLTLGPRPWALNGEKWGLSIAISYFHDLPTIQHSFDSCSAPSFPKSNVVACTLNRKKLDHNLMHDLKLYSTSFPLHSSVPMSWLRLGTKSHNRNKGKSSNPFPKYQISTEDCSSSSLACTSSPCLSVVKQGQQLHANEEHRTHVTPLVQVVESQPTNIFDDCGQGNGQEQNTVQLQSIVTGDFGASTESVDERKLGIAGTIPCHQEKGQLLLVEHNILSEAFVIVTSFPRTRDTESLLTDLLNTLNKILMHPDWADKYMRYRYHLSGLFANDQFTRSVRSLVNSFEEELTRNRTVEFAGAQEGCCSVSVSVHLCSCILPKLMLPLILRMLNYIQILWKKPITYDLSGIIAEDISFLLENGKLPEIDEDNMLKNAGTWLQGIREIGYNVIGLCASLDGAFYGLLGRSFIINVLMENLRSMEFNHLGKLIQLVFIPLVKYCPQECWDEWMVKLLEPIFSYCEETFYYAWFTFLHEGRAKVPAYFGNLNGPDEIVKQFEKELLLKFTRSVSDLLEVLASERLNSGLALLPFRPKIFCTKADFQDLKSISSSSLIGYLLQHNCFGRLSMYLFGCLADYQTAKKALPFCYSLIRLAIATNHESLNRFILNEMLPTIILLLGDIPSAISELSSSLNSATKEDARNDVTRLCQKIYEVYIDNQVTVGEGEVTETMPVHFKHWLAKELEDLHMRAFCTRPEHFPKDVVWKWEFNEEFERYLPAYMNMLEEVEAMDDCLKDNYMSSEILLAKLNPEFKLRYAINNYAHPCLQTMSRMLQRKIPAVYHQRRTEWISQLLIQLITVKPYIKLTDGWENVLERLEENCESQFDLLQCCDPATAVNIFRRSILFFWEPQFHPLIREGHMELLKTIAHQLAFAEGSVLFEPLEPHPDDFLEHLQPYARMYIKRKKEESEYYKAEEQVRLHEEFDQHLASGTLDHLMFSCSKDDFVHILAGGDIETSSFATLDHDLIKMSFERRAKIVEWEHQISCYFQCLTSLLKNEEMKDELGSLMNVLDAKGFFRVDDYSIDWDNKLFSDSAEKFNEVVFSGQCVDKCLVIRGIMDYQRILQMKDVDWQDAFIMVVRDTNCLWKEYLQQFWVETRHYKHKYYDTLAQPLQKVFLLGGAPKLKYG